MSRGVGCGRGGWAPSPEKKSLFVPKMISLGPFCRRFLQADNTDTVPWDANFTVQSRNEACKDCAKII